MKLVDKVTRENWVKGRFGNEEIGRCLVGHILTTPDFCGVLDLHEAIRALYPERVEEGQILFHFNDHPDTTFEDVQRVLKFADV